MRTAPVLTMWYRLSARQMGNAMMPMASDTASLIKLLYALSKWVNEMQPNSRTKIGQMPE